MLAVTNLISDRKFKIRNFEEDKIATLEANPGLRYDGEIKGFYKFSGNFFLKDAKGDLIESFGIALLLPKSYPNAFPLVFSTDNKIELNDDFHISKSGEICVEHTYVANKLISAGLRLYDFVEYYLPRYFSWVLLKQSGISQELEEWAHQEKGTIQVYETLLDTSDKAFIKTFLENYLKVFKIGRNDKCYCGSGKKLKHCHYEVALFLKSTSKKTIEKDILLFS
ncbi:SEC-C domain-containing protein [Elizabethkingia anophelis]|uniref:SEC-C domain-containing protein n=1 Tax=Elizabethkingia anophelis TaxID=1117645 RepID=UPI00066602B6|nr:SEC-C domain-containing protein [Elizabethkingia anophelis]